MRITGYVVLWNVQDPEKWGIAHANSHILIGKTLEQARQLVFQERELNEPEDWVYPNVRVMNLHDGAQWSLNEDDEMVSVEPTITY